MAALFFFLSFYTAATVTNAQQLIFRSGFESGSVGSPSNAHTDITGTDNSVAAPNNWVTDLEGHPKIGSYKIYYQSSGTASDRYARIDTDPVNSANKVLKYYLKTPDASVGRIQSDLYGNTNLTEVYYKFRMYFHPDMQKLESYPGTVNWLTIAEFWNEKDWENDPFPFRITLGLRKESGTGKVLHFKVQGEEKTGGSNGSWGPDTWENTNTGFTIPYSKWMTCEIHWKEGNAANGKFYFSVTPEGGSKSVIFDITNYTYHPDTNQPLDGLEEFSPFKLYTDPRFVNHVDDQGDAMQIYWDDFELWTGRPLTGGDTQAPTVPTGLSSSNISASGFTLSWSPPTDAVGVTGYDVFQNGAFKTSVTGTSAAITGLSASTQYSMTVKAKDATGNVSAASTALNVTTLAGCGSPVPWNNNSFTNQTGSFTAEFDAVPSGAGMDGVVGLSNGTAAAFTSLATALQFYSDGFIKARNGGTYAAANSLAYTAGTSYRVRMVVNVATRKYDIYVTPAGGSQVTIGTNYSFRTEQASVTQLNNRAVQTTTCGLTVSNFTVSGGSSDTQAPSAPSGLTVTGVTTTTAGLFWTGSTDNVGVTGYDVYQGATLKTSVTGLTATVTGLTAGTGYAFTVRAKDAAGNTSPASGPATANTAATCSGGPQGFMNTTFTSQSGTFTVEFDAVPGSASMDGVVSLNGTTTTAYTAMAAIVRFNTTNTIDARNGGVYAASNTVSYSPNTAYHFRLVLNTSTNRYDIYVRANGGAEQTIGTQYAFRNNTASFSNRCVKTEIGCIAISNFEVNGAPNRMAVNVAIMPVTPSNTQPGIYPNPLGENGELMIDFGTRVENTRIEIFDMNGKLVLTRTTKAVSKAKINTGNLLRKGVYIIKVSNDKKVHNYKLLLQ